MTVSRSSRPIPIDGPRSRGEPGLEGVGFLLGVAHRLRRRHWEECLGDLRLTAPQAAVLRLVAAQPGCGVRHLARRLGTDPMNVQRTLETLLAKGYCVTGLDPGDARRRPVHATDAGHRLARQVTMRAQETEQYLADLLGEDTYQALIDGLRGLVERDASPAGPAKPHSGAAGPAWPDAGPIGPANPGRGSSSVTTGTGTSSPRTGRRGSR